MRQAHRCTEDRATSPAFPLFIFAAREYRAVSTTYEPGRQTWATQVVERVGCEWRDTCQPREATTEQQAHRNHATALAQLTPHRR